MRHDWYVCGGTLIHRNLQGDVRPLAWGGGGLLDALADRFEDKGKNSWSTTRVLAGKSQAFVDYINV